MTMLQLFQPVAFIAILVGTALAHAQVDKPSGSVVDGPRNIRDFNPEDVSREVDASDIKLRKVFEDLGADATLWYQHVQTLANPFFEGRAPGTRGGELAAEYIQFYFEQYGLLPAFPTAASDTPGGGTGKGTAFSSFVQPFDLAAPDPKVELIRGEVQLGGQLLERGKDFEVLGVSGNATAIGPITFVGYGIESGPDGYTSFSDDTDLTGRIALVLRYEPLNQEGKSRWTPVRFSRHSSIAPKLEALVKRNAAGIILVNPPGALEGKVGLETLSSSAQFGDRLGIPAIQLSLEAVETLLSRAETQKRDLSTLRALADDSTVGSVNLRDELTISMTMELDVHDRLNTQNVAAVLPGKGELADQWVIIGAHFDHVGYGYTGTMPANRGFVHPGADDNASGTAGMLLAAKRLANDYATSPGVEHRRSIMFMAFGAEEAGLLGSRHFVQNSSIPSEKIYCMINMDMIGRLRSHNLLVQGTGTAKEFDELLQPIFEASSLTVSKVASGRGPSDHASFYNAGVPVLFMFTGEHDEYHKPQDRAYTVNPAGAVRIVELIQNIALEFSTRAEPLTFQNVGAGGAAPRAPSQVRLGIMPGYDANLASGILVEDVTEGTSAAEAGIHKADVLLTWNGEELTSGRKLSEVLASAKPGQKVIVTLRRGDQVMTLEVILKSRADGA